MSDPKRYAWKVNEENDFDLIEHSEGEYVRYEDYARLKAEVERLTSDIQMEKENEDRLVREWQKANNEVYGLQRQVAALIDDQTRLKAECQARQAENSVLAVECDSLKAEVERLKGIILAQSSEFVRNATKQEEEPLPDGWNSSVAKACDLLAEKDKDYARLKSEVERLTELNATISLRYDATKSMLDGCAKEIEEMEAEVERLTKAGDKAFSLWSSGDETDADNFKEAIWVWTVAKKGGQP